MTSPGEKVLVTGGGGFIGSHLVDHLVANGYQVRVLDNFATGRRENLHDAIDEVELVEGDIQSYERVHNAVRGSDVVFHLAALPSVPRSVQDPLTSHAANVTSTLNVLLAARDEEVRRVVFASSSSVYGPGAELPKREEMAPLPIAPYAVGKLASEGYCRSFTEVYGLETVALRYFNVFGPRKDPLSQYSAVIPRFISAVLEREQPTIHGDGEQSRDFTYVENAVQGTVLAAYAENGSGHAFNLACGERITLNAIVKELGSLAGREVESRTQPSRPGDVRHSLADISRARETLGYAPQIDFLRGLRLTFAYYESLAGSSKRGP